MQQQIELNLSISVFFNPQQLRSPVVDYFLTFVFTSKTERALSCMRIAVFSCAFWFPWSFFGLACVFFHGLGVSCFLPNIDLSGHGRSAQEMTALQEGHLFQTLSLKLQGYLCNCFHHLAKHGWIQVHNSWVEPSKTRLVFPPRAMPRVVILPSTQPKMMTRMSRII